MKTTQHKNNVGMLRVFRALQYSFAGLAAAWQHESAFRQEFLLAIFLIPLALYLPIGQLEKVVLVIVTLLILLVELINSSIEATIDRIALEQHELSKRAKDLGSAAVAIAFLIAILVWSVIAGPIAYTYVANFIQHLQ
jgi:diacylglycerol kinase (ATP)